MPEMAKVARERSRTAARSSSPAPASALVPRRTPLATHPEQLRGLSPASRAAAVRNLQARVGNQAVARLLGEGSPPPAVRHPDHGDQLVQREGRSSSGDQDANRGRTFVRSQAEPSAHAAEAVPASVANTVRSAGQPLQPTVQQEMASRLGADFAAVRTHTDAAASRSAEDIGARAYTVGSHIVFRAGEYQPSTPAGRQLLVHELTHVVPESSTPAGPLVLGDPHSPMEAEAERVAAARTESPANEAISRGASGTAHGAQRAGRQVQHQPIRSTTGNPDASVRTGSAYLVQRETKIKFPTKRVPLGLDILSDSDIKQLIEILETKPPPTVAGPVINVNNFVINLDGETLEKLLGRAKKKLGYREKVTGSFNVRGRAQLSPAGVVFSDDTGIRDLAEENSLDAYALEKESLVRQTYPREFEKLTLLIDQPAAKFWGESIGQRGKREDAGVVTGNERISYASANPWKQVKRLEGPCRRGSESLSRKSAMGNYSALNYAIAVGVGERAGEHSWEWLHLIGLAIGGDNKAGNLVAGTYDMNTLMIPLEQTIVEYSNRSDVSPQNPMTVTAMAHLWEDDRRRPTWVATTIKLHVSHGRNEFWLGPITLKTDILTTMEFDFYRYIFQRMAEAPLRV